LTGSLWKVGQELLQGQWCQCQNPRGKPSQGPNHCPCITSFLILGPNKHCLMDEMPIWIPSESFGVDIWLVVVDICLVR
jgi:hypothetical protein